MLTPKPWRRRRTPLFGIIAALIVLGVSSTAVEAPTRHVAHSEICFHRPDGVPDVAYDIDDYVRSHNFSPPRLYKGGSVFQNLDGKVDSFPGELLREYDLYPTNSQEPRGPERIVIGAVPFRSWYTPDHYSTFIDMYPTACFAWYLP